MNVPLAVPSVLGFAVKFGAWRIVSSGACPCHQVGVGGAGAGDHLQGGPQPTGDDQPAWWQPDTLTQRAKGAIRSNTVW